MDPVLRPAGAAGLRSSGGRRPITIASPVSGAHFVLEPHPAPQAQRSPLTALPAVPDLRWTIDGEPADTWIPTPGTHRVVVAHGQATDAIDIVYE